MRTYITKDDTLPNITEPINGAECFVFLFHAMTIQIDLFDGLHGKLLSLQTDHVGIWDKFFSKSTNDEHENQLDYMKNTREHVPCMWPRTTPFGILEVKDAEYVWFDRPFLADPT